MEALAKTLQKAAEPNYKKICPPEIVFLHNSLVLNHDNGQQEDILEFDFNAKEALVEWATAHRHLILNEDETETKSYRGVSVLQTIDAKLWKEKRLKKQQATKHNLNTDSCFNPNLIIKTKNEFHFDWSYSTPYVGSQHEWVPREHSGIKKEMLMDKNQPILFYDDIILYEDDLHDNGQVKLSVKIRIMPGCFYILQRLFVRVDYVLVRCRDVRIFCEFGGGGEVMRDVTWREIGWGDMGRMKDVGFWMEERFEVEKVPVVDLPEGVWRYSSLSLPR